MKFLKSTIKKKRKEKKKKHLNCSASELPFFVAVPRYSRRAEKEIVFSSDFFMGKISNRALLI